MTGPRGEGALSAGGGRPCEVNTNRGRGAPSPLHEQEGDEREMRLTWGAYPLFRGLEEGCEEAVRCSGGNLLP